MRPLVIATRGSRLAMWQARFVADALRRAHGGLEVRLETFRTAGDKMLDRPLHEVLDKGLFTKEIQRAILDDRADLAVHSLKDLPTEPTDRLTLAAVTAREDPADVVVAKDGLALSDLPAGAKVMSGSLRRKAQLLHLRGDLEVTGIRGNVETRLRKFDESDAAAIVFARAGLVRLGLAGRITERLDPEQRFLPAAGQAALAVEVRSDDVRAIEAVSALDDPSSRLAVTAERAFLAALGGGCQVPVGAFGRLVADTSELILTGMVAALDGKRLVRRTLSATVVKPADSERLGAQLAREIRDNGGQEILQAIRPDAYRKG